MKLRWKLFITLFCFAFVLTATAMAGPLPTAQPNEVGMSSERLNRIDTILKADIEKGKIPGAVVLVSRKGKIVYFKSFGMQDKEKTLPMKNDSIFRIYSMTKPFISVATMILFEEGKLLLSDPVSKYIPAFKDVQVGEFGKDDAGKDTLNKVKPKRAPTIHHLLTHTSGLSYGWYLPKAFQGMFYGASAKNKTIEEEADKIAKLPLVFHPGTKYQYSTSFDVLGRVVEVASGMPLDQFLEKRIFQPLGMPDSGFNVQTSNLGRVVYMNPKTFLYSNLAKTTTVFSGGGGAVSTAMDYARFSHMLLNGGQLGSTSLLGPRTVTYMSSDHLGSIGNRPDPGYVPGVGYGQGFGFYVRVDAGRSPFIGNVGEFYKGGYGGTVFWVDPKEDLYAVFMMTQPSLRLYYRYLIKSMIYQAIVN